jgi:hypothetical protein
MLSGGLSLINRSVPVLIPIDLHYLAKRDTVPPMPQRDSMHEPSALSPAQIEGEDGHDKDKAELKSLETIVRRRKTIGSIALSEESGISVERIFELFTTQFCSVRREPHPFDHSLDELWTYTSTMADEVAEYESKEQENQMERQRHQVRMRPF